MPVTVFIYLIFMLSILSVLQCAWTSLLISASPRRGHNTFSSSPHFCSAFASPTRKTLLLCNASTNCLHRRSVLRGGVYGSTWKFWILIPAPWRDLLRNACLSLAPVSDVQKARSLALQSHSLCPQFPYPHEHQEQEVGRQPCSKLKTQLVLWFIEGLNVSLGTFIPDGIPLGKIDL